jgi:signal peptidase I
MEVGETLVLTVLIFVGLQTFVAQPFQIHQDSMEQTLEPDQYVLVDKLTTRWATYARGDIVVFKAPVDVEGGKGTPLIKRVIGLPGDTVSLQDGHVLIDGRQLDEPYLYQESGEAQPTDPTGGASSWTVPAGDVFLMGDHRAVSLDSRVFGPVAIDAIIGRAWLRYWPFDSFGVIAHPTYASP